MIQITLGQLIGTLVGLSGLFLAIIARLSRAKAEQMIREQAAMWRRLDEQRGTLSAVRDDLYVKYYDREETKEIVRLNVLPIVQRLDEVKALVERNNDLVMKLVAD